MYPDTTEYVFWEDLESSLAKTWANARSRKALLTLHALKITFADFVKYIKVVSEKYESCIACCILQINVFL